MQLDDSIPSRQIRAAFTDTTIRVYQAYGNDIADNALRAQTFISPFQKTRMTWIKPSFLWMMYRSGWGTKSGQERILAIDITRTGFEWALSHSCLSDFESNLYSSNDNWKSAIERSPVRIQWDPERNLKMERLDYRTIQIGLSCDSVQLYINEWIRQITDLTEFVSKLRKTATADKSLQRNSGLLPHEKPYPITPQLARAIGIVD